MYNNRGFICIVREFTLLNAEKVNRITKWLQLAMAPLVQALTIGYKLFQFNYKFV